MMNPRPRRVKSRNSAETSVSFEQQNRAELIALKANLLSCVRKAGKILLRYFGRVTNPRLKESQSSVVCDADLASEKFIVGHIKKCFPTHSIISEESGCTWGPADYTWVVDPLDGTSNFVAGLPWFGVQIGVLRGAAPVLAAMYLPIEDTLYFAQAGRGAYRNGKRITVTPEADLANVLCAFGFDPSPVKRSRNKIELLFRVSGAVRNTRATNSLVDFCCTIDGRFGACVNLKTKIWDIVPVSIILPEAGGKFTDLDGNEIVFRLDARSPEREYAVVGASAQLHSQLVSLTRGR
jgi:myo-inositol-1(or 4)-monophosphatase